MKNLPIFHDGQIDEIKFISDSSVKLRFMLDGSFNTMPEIGMTFLGIPQVFIDFLSKIKDLPADIFDMQISRNSLGYKVHVNLDGNLKINAQVGDVRSKYLKV